MSLTPLILLGLKFSSNFEECTSVKNAQVLSTQYGFVNLLATFYVRLIRHQVVEEIVAAMLC